MIDTGRPPDEFASHLARLAARIAGGESPGPRELVPLLGHSVVERRLEAALALADAFLRRGDEARAGQLVERAWWLSGQAPELLDTYLHFKLKAGDTAAVRAAYKHQGMVAARGGRVAEALAWFNRWQNTDIQHADRDVYHYDADVLAAIDGLAAPARLVADDTRPGPGERIRLAYLMHGVVQANSVLVRLSRLFAAHHDPAHFELAFFVPDPGAAVLQSPQGLTNLKAIADLGWQVVVAPDGEDDAETLLHLAEAIQAFRPHLMVLSAGLADLRHHYLRALRPASRVLGLLSGPPAQFVAPDLDAAIAWTWHPLMDSPVPCHRVTPEIDLPDRAAVRPWLRARLGIPDGAVLLAAGGRPAKFRSPDYWRLVAACLETHAEAWFTAIGTEEAAVADLLAGLSPAARARLRFVPWTDAYLEVLASVDVLLDTYPSGGGAVVLDAMALGIPVVAFENDYLKPFDQSDWSPAQELLPDAGLVVPRGDGGACLKLLGRLIAQPALRRALGEQCRQHAVARYGQPGRMVAACEQVYADLLGVVRPARPDTAQPPPPVCDPTADILARALALHRGGQIVAAASGYRQILDRHPDHLDALHLLGVAEEQQGHLDEALRLFGRALELDPGWVEARGNLGNVLARAGDASGAEAAFRQAIGQRPDLPLVHFNLANLIQEQGRVEEAVAHYRQALAHAPGLSEAALNLGIALARLGRHEEAIACLSEARQRAPAHPDILARLAALEREMGRTGAAEAVLEEAVRRLPGQAGLHLGLGNVRLDQGRLEAAVECFRAALAVDPDHAEAHFALAETLRELGREDEAGGHYARAVALAPDNAAFRLGVCMAALPVVTLTEAEEAAALGRFAAALAELAAWAATPGRLVALGAVVGQTQPFLLAYREGDHTETLGRYGDLVCRARAAWFAQRFQAPAAPPARPRRRLVVVSGHLRRHSVWDVLVHGVLRRLDRSRFEVIVYHTVAGTDGETTQARALANRFEQGPRSEQDWIALMLRDAPDCIWYPEVAMDPATVKLASLRLAPLQVASWGHPITTGLPTIDRFLSGELIEPDGADRHYREALVRLPGCGACPVPPPEPVLPTREVATGRPPRFLVGQQAAKLSPRFDAMLAAIARGAGVCEVIVCRDRKYAWASARVEARLRRAFEAAGVDPDACLRFVDWRPREAFLALLDEVDVYLDVPAFSGYTTAWLALRRGLPVVTVAGPFMRQRLAAGLLRQLGVADTVADSGRHYVDLAVRLGADAAWREALRGRIAAALPALDRHGEVVDALERALLAGVGGAAPV